MSRYELITAESSVWVTGVELLEGLWERLVRKLDSSELAEGRDDLCRTLVLAPRR